MHRNLECQVYESRQIGSGQTGDGKIEQRQFQNRELKQTGMGEFNLDDHYIYYCGRNPSKEMEPSWSTKESEMQYLNAISKMTE